MSRTFTDSAWENHSALDDKRNERIAELEAINQTIHDDAFALRGRLKELEAKLAKTVPKCPYCEGYNRERVLWHSRYVEEKARVKELESEKRRTRMIKPKVTVREVYGNWCAHLQIDNQGFTFVPQEDKDGAIWYAKMLRIALKKLSDLPTEVSK